MYALKYYVYANDASKNGAYNVRRGYEKIAEYIKSECERYIKNRIMSGSSSYYSYTAIKYSNFLHQMIQFQIHLKSLSGSDANIPNLGNRPVRSRDIVNIIFYSLRSFANSIGEPRQCVNSICEDFGNCYQIAPQRHAKECKAPTKVCCLEKRMNINPSTLTPTTKADSSSSISTESDSTTTSI